MIFPSGQCRVFFHCLDHKTQDFTGKMTQMIGNASLEIRLILNSPGKTRAMRVYKGRNTLSASFAVRVDPLSFPTALYLERYPLKAFLQK